MAFDDLTRKILVNAMGLEVTQELERQLEDPDNVADRVSVWHGDDGWSLVRPKSEYNTMFLRFSNYAQDPGWSVSMGVSDPVGNIFHYQGHSWRDVVMLHFCFPETAKRLRRKTGTACLRIGSRTRVRARQGCTL